VIIKIIEKYDALIASWKIIEYDQDGPNLRIKAEFHFMDGSRFFVRQVVLNEFMFKYAYHWQDKDGQLRSRWDNAPHWPDIPTHPHHKHVMSDDKVFVEVSKGGDLEAIFDEIAIKITPKGFCQWMGGNERFVQE
jgi:Family of unknown function (DUF6516)